MIGLLLLGFLVVLICAAWLAMRKVASLGTRSQILIATPAVCLILLAPIEFFTGYSLATIWGPTAIVTVACSAYVLLMFLLWHKSRTMSVVGLATPVLLFVATGSFGWLVVLSMILGNASTVPTAEGRVSPIASYRVVQYPGIWGGATQAYTYEIYENPRGLPFVWKEVAHDHIPCGQGFDADSLLIRAGANDHLVVISCRKPEPDFSSKQIPIG